MPLQEGKQHQVSLQSPDMRFSCKQRTRVTELSSPAPGLVLPVFTTDKLHRPCAIPSWGHTPPLAGIRAPSFLSQHECPRNIPESLWGRGVSL